MNESKKARIMVDSGAFSAWRLGRPVDLDLYCDFLEANLDWIEQYVCLDVIIPDDPERAAKESFDNLVLMRARGLDPIPVFHVREGISWLQRMLDLGCPYIGLSATSIVSRNATDDWYDFAWSYLVDSTGAPVVRTHAFGEAREEVLTRYPWTSADTSTWINAQRYGQFFMEDGRRLSHNMKLSSSKSAPDIDLLEGEDHDIFVEEMQRLSVDRSALLDRRHRDAWLARSYLAAKQYTALERRVQARLPIRFVPPATGLVTGPRPPKTRDWQVPDEFTLYLSVGTNNTTVPSLHIVGCRSFLSSYFYIDEKLGRRLRAYVEDPEAAVSVPPYSRFINDLTRITADASTRPLQEA